MYVIVHIIIKTRTCTHSPVRLREVCLYFSILSLHVNQYSDPEHVTCSESHVKSSDPKTHARTRRCDLFCLLKVFHVCHGSCCENRCHFSLAGWSYHSVNAPFCCLVSNHWYRRELSVRHTAATAPFLKAQTVLLVSQGPAARLEECFQ